MADVTQYNRPPVRYSVSMPHFDPEVGRRLMIKLDGVEQDKVIGYDAENGLLIRYVCDDGGDYKLNEARDDVLRETVEGTVTVEWKPD